MPRLLYIGQNPTDGTGSPIVVLRHLERFAAHGWDLDILADYGGNYAACRAHGWNVRPLCHRRWWWPPYRPNHASLRWMRLRLLAKEAAASTPTPDVILSYLSSHSDFSAQLAVQVAQVNGAPLHFLVHDDATAFPAAAGRELVIHRVHRRILRAATMCWFVSPELADCFPSVTARRLLLPIPNGWDTPARWQPRWTQQPRIYYAGHVWPQQLDVLGRIARTLQQHGAQLVVMAAKSAGLDSLCAAAPVVWQAPFPTNREALAHLATDAAGVLVSYADTVEAMPWSATSFPSKLVEYAHLGLPIAIVAPPETAVGNWARRAQFAASFPPRDLAPLARWVQELRQPETWSHHADTALHLARTAFAPEEIHRQLEDSLLPVSRRRAA